jgi:membrane protein
MLNIIRQLAIKSFQEWNNDDAAQLAAAIAYYTIISIPPLLIIVMAITGYFINTSTAQNQLIAQIGGFIGPQTSGFVKSLLENSTQSSNSPIASIISIVVLLAGASGAFYQVQYALNKIWDVPQKHGRTLINLLKNRFLSFLMALAIGFLLMFFLILSAVISVVISYMSGGTQNMFILEVINFLVLFVTVTILFAMIYRVIPDKQITWTDVWLGAAVTALLFMLGRYAVGLYLTVSKSGSAYGAAGSLIVLLLWIYYSAQIFLLGAEFTHVYSKKLGSQIESEEKTISMVEKTPLEHSLRHEE